MIQRLGPYELLSPIGAGGMGEVFLARLEREEGFTRQVAVKRILPELSRDPVFREMFAAEARLSAKLQHPDIVQVLDFGHEGDTYYLAMEYVQGADLAAILTKKDESTLPLDFCMSVLLSCVRALDHAHSRTNPVVHGDVCPANVLVGKHGEVKLTDFGLARFKNIQHGLLAGHLEYLAPEVAMGQVATCATDQFSLGAMILQMLTGKGPYPYTPDQDKAIEFARRGQLVDMQELDKLVPPGLGAVVKKTLELNPEKRFESMDELKQALELLVEGLSLSVGGTTVERVLSEKIELPLERSQQQSGGTIVAEAGGFSRKKAPRKTKTIISFILLALFVIASVYFYLNQYMDSDISGSKLHKIASVEKDDHFTKAPPSTQISHHVDNVDPAGPGKHPSPSVESSSHEIKITKKPAYRQKAKRTKKIEAPRTLVPSVPKKTSGTDENAKVATAEKSVSLSTLHGTSWAIGKGSFASTALEHYPLRAGSHLIRLRGQDMSAAIRIDVLENSMVHLSVRTKPFAIVELDGRPRGTSPLGGLELLEGTHALKLKTDSSNLELNITVP